MAGHRLRREIVCNEITNGMVNRAGITYALPMQEQTGAMAADAARAYTILREVFAMPEFWSSIESLDNQVPAVLQLSTPGYRATRPPWSAAGISSPSRSPERQLIFRCYRWR